MSRFEQTSETRTLTQTPETESDCAASISRPRPTTDSRSEQRPRPTPESTTVSERPSERASQTTNLRNVNPPAVHPQRVRDPAVPFLLAHPTPAGIVKGAARMVMVGAHGESPTVRLGRFRRGFFFLFLCIFLGERCTERTMREKRICEGFVWREGWRSELT